MKQSLGWYLDAEFTGDALTAIPTEQTETNSYARWQESTYEVTFDSNGGSEFHQQVEEGLLV